MPSEQKKEDASIPELTNGTGAPHVSLNSLLPLFVPGG